jgi:hypothetical protein
MTQDKAAPIVTPLHFDDEELVRQTLPKAELRVWRGIGSGLCVDAEGRVWAVGDRGPNLKVKLAVKRYGVDAVATHAGADGAKVMPCPEIGPAMSELAIDGDRVTIVRTLPLLDRDGRPISGLPVPGGQHMASEPALAIDGAAIPPDPSGVDSEGIAPAPDGGFWIGDEYGPSLLRVGADGAVLARWVPERCGEGFADARYPVEERLPAIAVKRRLNRGFEALATSADGRWLHLAFQSPLSHPDDDTHERACHVRLWRLNARTGAVAAQWAYPLDPPHAFRRDAAKGEVERSDIKVSEIAAIGPDRLLVLERASETTKLYAVDLSPDRALGPEHLDPATRPTLEELSARGKAPPALDKRLVFDSDAHPEVSPDLEGLAVLGPRTLLLVNDNDFGIEGVRTRFWRVKLAEDL